MAATKVAARAISPKYRRTEYMFPLSPPIVNRRMRLTLHRRSCELQGCQAGDSLKDKAVQAGWRRQSEDNGPFMKSSFQSPGMPVTPPCHVGALVVSIVSHGHGAMVQKLIWTLARLNSGVIARVVLTLNLPEAEPARPAEGWPFALQVIINAQPAGFGTNHNRALAGAKEPFVCVLNPDVELAGGDPFVALVRSASMPGTGCAYPGQLDAQGRFQDSERELPTPWVLLRRHVTGRRETKADWVNAACLVLPQPVWQTLGGFDEAYFMYCEDVDLCLRLRLVGLDLVHAPVQVVHAGQRASQRRWEHLRWHVQSLLHLWRSSVYRQACQLLRAQANGAGTIGRS